MAEFAWASIGGADAEPVELIERDGRKGILTIGCPDPFWLDDETAGIRMSIGRIEKGYFLTLETAEERQAREDAYQRRINAPGYKPHSWRGPR